MNHLELADFIKKYSLTEGQVASATRVSIAVVKGWLDPAGATEGAIPDKKATLLKNYVGGPGMDAVTLRAYMQTHRLTARKVAEMTDTSVPTVRSWLRPKSSKAARNMQMRTELVLRAGVVAEAAAARAKKQSLPAPDESTVGHPAAALNPSNWTPAKPVQPEADLEQGLSVR